MTIEILQTKQWLEQVIIELNFCPFAKKEFVNNTIHYHCDTNKKMRVALETLAVQYQLLVDTPEIETSLVIFTEGFRSFDQYLDLLDYANDLLVNLGFEGMFQLASFHPDYCFDGEDFDDASNFTNRSPYPTIHILREASLEKVLAVFKEPESIPENNIALAQSKGADFFKQLMHSIKHI